MSKDCLERLTKHLHTFLRKVVTTDETWTYHYIPETIEQSKQWKPAPTSEEAKSVASVGKVIAQIFWDFKGIVMIDYLPKGQTITGEYYVNQTPAIARNNTKKPAKNSHEGALPSLRWTSHTTPIPLAKIHWNFSFNCYPLPQFHWIRLHRTFSSSKSSK